MMRSHRNYHGRSRLGSAHADICSAAPQNFGAPNVKTLTVLVPQREGFGLCGTVPGALFVDTWPEADSRKADFLTPNRDDVLGETSRINTYTTPLNASTRTSSQASLPACPGVLWALRPPLRGLRYFGSQLQLPLLTLIGAVVDPATSLVVCVCLYDLLAP